MFPDDSIGLPAEKRGNKVFLERSVQIVSPFAWAGRSVLGKSVGDCGEGVALLNGGYSISCVFIYLWVFVNCTRWIYFRMIKVRGLDPEVSQSTTRFEITVQCSDKLCYMNFQSIVDQCS